MKAKIPKSWNALPPAEKTKIEEYLQEICVDTMEKQIEKDMRVVFELYIKMVCVVLHDAFGFGEKRLYMFLGNHKRLFHRQARLVRNNEQVAYLDRRINEIFSKDGFPKEFFNEMLGDVENENEESTALFVSSAQSKE